MSNRSEKLTAKVANDAKPAAKRYSINDTETKGLKLVVSPSGRKTFMLRYRVGGGRAATIREPAIGQHGTLTVDQARKIAREWLVRASRGEDPSAQRAVERSAPRMTDLFDRFIDEYATVHKKRSSIDGDRLRIERHLKDEFGNLQVTQVTRQTVLRFHTAMAGFPIEANRCLALLSKCMNLAEAWGMRPDGTNPCRHVRRYAENKRRRYLSPAELARLGEALRKAESGALGHVTWQSIAFVRLAVFTGMRRQEILGLRWDAVNFDKGIAVLAESKTGWRQVQLPSPALQVLQQIERQDGNPYVLPGGKPGAHIVNIYKNGWEIIRDAAGLSDVHAHDLRHSFASVGAGGGASLPVIGALLGHSHPATTARYAHLADDPLRAAADAIGGKVAAAMEGASSDIVPLPSAGKKP